MTRVVFELASGRDGTIQLKDGEFIEMWKDIFKHNKPLGIMPCSHETLSYNRSTDAELQMRNQVKYDPQRMLRNEVEGIRLILSGMEDVRDMSIPWTRSRPTMGMDWDTTNDIHRGFTTVTLTGCIDRVVLTHEEKNALMVEQYNFNSAQANGLLRFLKTDNVRGFPQDRLDERDSFMFNICKINSGVHNIEDRCRISQRVLDIESGVYPEHDDCSIPKLDWQSKDPSDNRTDRFKVSFDVGDLAAKGVDNNPHWNVYDLKNILGKDYLQAYYDYDDPGEWDVCNHYHTTKGGFEIKPHMHHVVNQVLVPWIRGWGYTAYPEIVSPVPVGHIDEKELLSMCTPNASNSWDITRNDITKVDLIE